MTYIDIKILKRAIALKCVLPRGVFYKKYCFLDSVDLTEDIFSAKNVEGLQVELNPFAKIETKHAITGYKGFFKPSVEEVLMQIPVEDYPEAVAFSVKNDYKEFPECYLSTTTLYRLPNGQNLPKQIESQPIIYRGTKFTVDQIHEMKL